MQFKTPDGETFEISTDLWESAEMPDFISTLRCYKTDDPHEVVPITEVAPPLREPGIEGFGENGLNDERLFCILTAFRSNKPLPPVDVIAMESAEPYRYRVYDGTHRYRASVAAGFSHLPVRVIRDPQQFLNEEKEAGALTVRLTRSDAPEIH